MNEIKIKSSKTRIAFYIFLAGCGIAGLLYAVTAQKWFVFAGVIFWEINIWLLYLTRRKSWLHEKTIDALQWREKVLIVIVLVLTILGCTLPMSVSPKWNGEIPEHRNQYEVMTESILEGHLYLNYDDVDPRLETLINPYDPNERARAGVRYYWDHAYYKGHYYMYFGVAPVFLLFLPYRLLTGNTLVTYQATQIFVAFIIIGFYSLFFEMAKAFFKKMSLGLYLFLSTAFSCISVWYSVGAPALYCTAIMSAVCLEIWSLFFFIKAVWIEKNEKKQLVWAMIGALAGALTFGCRPPIALANLLVLPMLIEFLRNKKITRQLIIKLFLAASPYIVVGVMLMMYNYLRFDNVFEFGQSYQLTLADQHNYNLQTNGSWYWMINGILYNFLFYSNLSSTFPFISHNGILVNFPLFLSAVGVIREKVQVKIKQYHLHGVVMVLIILPVIITVIDTVWTPWLSVRYHLDIYFLLSILCFLIIGLWHRTTKEPRKLAGIMMRISLLTCWTCFLLFAVPYDSNPTDYYPELLNTFQKVILFWKFL